MKHEFTDSEIANAADQAVDATTSHYRNISIEYHKAFLDALPEPKQDDFQRGGVILDTYDVRKGDRVLIMNFANNLYEVTVTHVDENAIFWKGSSITKSQIDRIHLLDRPVQHPDPKKHPVILVHEASGITRNPPVVALSARIPETERYRYVFSGYGAQWPSDITEWEPADVVPRVADNENS